MDQLLNLRFSHTFSPQQERMKSFNILVRFLFQKVYYTKKNFFQVLLSIILSISLKGFDCQQISSKPEAVSIPCSGYTVAECEEIGKIEIFLLQSDGMKANKSKHFQAVFVNLANVYNPIPHVDVSRDFLIRKKSKKIYHNLVRSSF